MSQAIRLSKVVLTCSVILFQSACSTNKPYTGETVTQVTDESGITTTITESRELLPNGKIAGSESVLRQISSEVVAVNAKTRMLTVKTADNKTASLHVDKAVTNLPQVKAGDRVSLDYFESVAFEVRKPTAQEIQDAQTAVGLFAKAAPGEKPGAVVAMGKATILTVKEIDKTNDTISVSGPYGNIAQVKVKHPENLNYVKVGDTVVVTASELLIAKIAPVS